MKIDSHQHFWIYNEKEYAWINERMSILKNDFLPGDLEPELSSMGFDGSICVQARQTLEETRWLLKLADSNKFVKGVVGWVDLCSPAVESQLAEFASFEKLVGIRHVIHDEPDDDFMLCKDFINGISYLSEFKLSFDLLVFPRHLKNAVRLAVQFPEQRIILDHMAKPEIKGKKLSPWKEDILELSKFPHIFCKLSGMVTEADVDQWKENDFKEYLDIVVEGFGCDRLMIGSDWPVCRLAGSYSKVIGIVMKYFSNFTESDKKKVFGLNAAKAYDIKIL
jgi:L-fuconolactonase